MKSNIQKRKKRFWAICLALVLVLVKVMPTSVFATDYTVKNEKTTYWLADANGNKLNDGDILNPGDTFTYMTNNVFVGSVNINYYYSSAYDRIETLSEVISPANTENQSASHTVKSYEGVTGGSVSQEAFKGWKLYSVEGNSYGHMDSISFIATAYTQSTITYVTDGGTHSNPDTYYEGKEEIILADATKDGFTFDGWYSDDKFTTKVTSIPKNQTEDITLYAKFLKNYSIDYVLNGGTHSATNPTQYTTGTGVSSFADASKDGYTFAGWYSDAALTTQVTSISADETGNITLYAKFLKNNTITYFLDGGENGAGNPSTYTEEIGVASLADATKENYDFAGWYTDAEFTNKVTSIGTDVTGDIKLYARFTPKQFTITYELDGGENAGGNPEKYSYGIGVTSFEDPIKSGYTFGGWYSDAAFTTKVTSISTTKTGNITLYAKYTSNAYGITYVLDGGTNAASNPLSYTYGEGVASFAGATKTGYTFAGWYSDSDFATEVTSISDTQLGDVVLYAKYTANDYTITYELDGGTNGAGNPTSYTYGVGVSSFANASKEGYTFEGWYSGDDDLTEVTSISDTQFGDVTLYAKYKANKYSITYELNGGTNGAGNPSTYTYGEGVTSFADASKTGYTFAGWYGDTAFTTKVTSISGSQTGAVTLHAKFIVNTYGITYVMDGGTNPASNPNSYTYGEGVTGFADASKEGYTFAGWYSDAAFTTKVISISENQTGTVTLYARFTANEYGITYKLDGGINGAGNPTSYIYGEGVASFADASKEGYTFDGWYSDAEFKTKVTSVSGTQMGEVILYAKFIANVYGIKYELDGGTNGAGNPIEYTYGEGITSFANASKEGYAFDGWYLDAAFTTKITSISTTQIGDVTLYAKYIENAYEITYVMNGGINPVSNPLSYAYGEGVASFADASKEGYTFNGWYSDAAFTKKVTSIPATKMGNITLYAKFTKIMKEGTGSITVDNIYYGDTLNVSIESETNGTDHVTISYKKKGESDSSYISTAPVKAGDYTARAIFEKTEDYYQVVATDDFSILKRKGKGSISVADVGYGKTPEPVVSSATNGIDHVTILYKQRDASDDTYTETKPSEIGRYMVKAIFAETEGYLQAVATDEFLIGYLSTPENPYQINGTLGENQYYTSVVSLIPAQGYVIANSLGGTYNEKLELTKTTEAFSVYLKKADTGEMTSAIEVPAIKIDTDAPVIQNIESGSTIYGDEVEVVVKDEHLSKVFVNDEEASFDNGTAVLKLSSNNGEENYTLTCVDEAGNRSTSRFVIAAEWMKSKTIPTGKVRLFSKYAYQLGNGKWRVGGDSTTYSGNITFYIGRDGDYNFSNAN